MRKIVGILILVGLILTLSSMKENNKSSCLETKISAKDSTNKGSLYDFKKSRKQIDRITKQLITDTAYFQYGAQSYRKYNVQGTTSFYNQPTEILHYILLAEGGRTFHFEIPLVQLSGITMETGDQQFLELRFRKGQAGFIKEYNASGGLVYALGFTMIKLPLPKSVNTHELMKQFSVLMKKVEKYNLKNA